MIKDAETCVSCGTPIPEGRQLCPKCDNESEDELRAECRRLIRQKELPAMAEMLEKSIIHMRKKELRELKRSLEMRR